jgi:hypothetical protein
MKKVISMIALAAICLGTVSAAIPVNHATAKQDTTVKKTKKMKKMKKDTTKM